MGQEIENTHFTAEDNTEFHKRLREETKVLKSWFDKDIFSKEKPMTGIELEGWLVDENMLPSPNGQEFISTVSDEQIVPEISRFNFELNSNPYDLTGSVLSDLEKEMSDLWNKCEEAGPQCETKAVMMGTLATLRPNMLSMEYLSPHNRYHAMNEMVMNLRKGKPLHIHLEAKDQVDIYMDSVIAECAATSLQIHLGVTQENAKRYYNAAIIASSFLVAISANSPYFFGSELWDESRIAVFEQAVDLESFRKLEGGRIKRVTMGNNYLHGSLLELFVENLDAYPVLLPEIMNENPDELNHLRLHNGTVWRWIRPIVGVNPKGRPHLRIEQRTPSAGPTVKDTIANTAFFHGLVHYLANMENPPEDLISFADSRENFYKASKQSMYCKVKWIDGKEHDILKLMKEELFPNIRRSLVDFKIDEEDIKLYVDDIIWNRLDKGINGARWQKAWIHMHGKKFQELMEVYLKNQMSGKPVHEWSLD